MPKAAAATATAVTAAPTRKRLFMGTPADLGGIVPPPQRAEPPGPLPRIRKFPEPGTAPPMTAAFPRDAETTEPVPGRSRGAPGPAGPKREAGAGPALLNLR
ncbi:hypothetical protein GCM10010172_40450 [Paractinoplanes ferrugineus]|uniref:Uncharacterized protein n=1 Tax=Paractinoplanes ferrugineus TaxID=113564 RepID=A0A919MQT3_9ACTN|nr:hypothetical protein Afe05nite_84920 [Actinoplanes ferrugineus]